ncbi:MAG TPA: hypothetical protein VKG23_17380 [Thermoanaerobaculia bacterium]|nr:hypothetical protein [Thermoanaerobaculia bacterium]
MKLDPREAHYVLETLIAKRRIAERHVREILNEREKEIAALRRRLGELERLGARATAAATATTVRTAGRARRNLSPKVRALRRQQGQYMGLVRRLKASEKARVSALREKKGLPAAIKLARSLGRS